MAIVYTWTITQLDCYPEAEGQMDVAFNTHWTCAGTDGTYNASVYSTQTVNYVAGTPYTPYADLTQDQVLGWIWGSGVNKDATEILVAQLIENQVNPPVITPPLPWAK